MASIDNRAVYAPIVLFVYNRPAHTRQTVEALQKNALAIDSNLIIYSDAPKKPEAAEAVREVRAYLREIAGFKSVKVIERDKNWGLANSIIDGVTSVVNECGRVIVLEDDLVTSPHFLKFMNDALEMYKSDDRVMHISGATYPIKSMEGGTFFLRIPLCWGWATWDRAWQHFRKNDDVMLKFDREMRKDFTFNDTYHSWKQLELNQNGSINTWFIYWYATLFLRGGLALFPGKSLVKNIGMDGSGVHCGANTNYDMELSISAIQLMPISVNESEEAVIRHESYFRKIYPPAPPLHIRIYRKVRRAIKWLARTIRSD
jgi:hypothetical protein